MRRERIDRALDLLERLVSTAERAVALLERGAGQGAPAGAPLDTEASPVRPKLTPKAAKDVEAALRRRGAA